MAKRVRLMICIVVSGREAICAVMIISSIGSGGDCDRSGAATGLPCPFSGDEIVLSQ